MLTKGYDLGSVDPIYELKAVHTFMLGGQKAYHDGHTTL